MATGEQGFVRAAVPRHSGSARREGEMHVQAPVAAMYIQAVPGLPTAVQDAAVIPLPVPVMCANQAVPFLALHVSSGAAVHQQKPDVAATPPRPKAAGKHVCAHCGRDCLKPSVLEKHIRSHTGERPYPCKTCGISFKTQSNLYKHKRTQAHARLSSESGKGTCSSQESTESFRETCSSPSLELPSEDPASGGSTGLPVTSPVCAQVGSVDGRAWTETEQASCRASVVPSLSASPAHGQQEPLRPAGQLSREGVNEASPMPTESPTRATSTPNRTPLQRQEALFPKLSRGQTQSHGSTDSGFSDGSEPNFTCSPGPTPHDPSMESLAESSMELQEPASSRSPSDVTGDDTKGKVSVQEKQKLEEHILKLISENSVLVDDKHLLNVRPRKMVLSKQGSIDLPMPYTYKDSFHFEMRSTKHHVSSSPRQDRRGRAGYASMPTQTSASVEHAPLTRSSSLPFSMGIQNSERTASPHHGGAVPLSRRCSAGNLCTLDQHPPGHRLLVRQAAVDCLPGAEISAMHSGSHGGLSSDGDCPHAPAESAGKRSRRTKAQKFAYNKWYMYGGGTFKKLYDAETGGVQKSRTAPPSVEQTESQRSQTSQQRESNSTVSPCAATSLPPAGAAHPACTSSQLASSYVLLQSRLIRPAAQPLQPGPANQNAASDTDNEAGCVKGAEEKHNMQLSSLIPSERKKQRTGDEPSALAENAHALMKQLNSGSRQPNLRVCDVTNQPSQSGCDDLYQSAVGLQKDARLNLHRQGSLTNLPASNPRQLLCKRHSSPLFVASENGTSTCSSASSLASSSVASSAPRVTPSFLPMYQLKIPCFTDGASDSQLRNPLSCSSSHQPAQQGLQETNLPPVLQGQSTTAGVTLGQGHEGTLTETKSVTSLACKGQGVNLLGKAQTLHQAHSYTSVVSATCPLASSTAQSKPVNTPVQNQSTPYTVHNMSAGPLSSVLSQPCQTFTPLGQNQSVAVSATPIAVSLLSHSSTSETTSQVYTAATASTVQSRPATPVVISKELLDTHASVSHRPMDSTSLGISHTGLQRGQGENRMILVNESLQSLAQDTFYVRTADLQIVMQLISDEQLALIEPQIETQDFKLDGSHSFPRQDSETSQPDAVQTGVSQEIHRQRSDHTVRKACVSQADTSSSMFSKVQDVVPLSAAATEQQNSGENAQDAHGRQPENAYLTKTMPTGVISRLHSAHCATDPLDSRAKPLGQQCPTHEANHPGSAGCGISITSCPGREVPPADKPATETGMGQLSCCAPAHGSKTVSVSRVCEGEQSSRGTPGAVHAPLALPSSPAASTERTPASKEKAPFWPDIPASSDTCQLEDCQPAQMSAAQPKSCRLLSGTSKSVEGENGEVKAEAACDSLSVPASSKKELLSAAQPRQQKPCQPARSTPATESTTGSGGALAPVVCQRPGGAHGGDGSNLSCEVQRDDTCSPGQASGQHVPQPDRWSQTPGVTGSNGEEGKGLTHVARAHFNPHKPVSKGTAGACHVNGDPCKGPWLGGSLQSSQLHWEAGTGIQGWVPQEPKTGKEEIKTEGTTGHPEVNQTAVNPDENVSQPATKVCHNTPRPAELPTSSVPHNCTPAGCGATGLSHNLPALCQRERVSLINSEEVRGSTSVKTVQEFISQSTETGGERAASGCKRFTSLPTGHHHSTCGHPSSENVNQKDKNSATQSHSRRSQLSEHKRDGAAEFDVSSEPCVMSSLSNTATCGAVNTAPADPSSHSKINTHNNPQEPPASQCHVGGGYVDEEGTSSSSDDEGKLVIELE